MAWEELLRLHDTQKESRPLPESETVRENGSLIRQVCDLFGRSAPVPPSQTEADAVQVPPRCADGYLRRSPVQPYGVAEDFGRRRIRRIVMIVVGAIFVGLLIYALMRAGLLIFRLR